MSANVADTLLPQVLKVHPTVHPHPFVLLAGGKGGVELLDGVAAPGGVFVELQPLFMSGSGGG